MNYCPPSACSTIEGDAAGHACINADLIQDPVRVARDHEVRAGAPDTQRLASGVRITEIQQDVVARQLHPRGMEVFVSETHCTFVLCAGEETRTLCSPF